MLENAVQFFSFLLLSSNSKEPNLFFNDPPIPVNTSDSFRSGIESVI